MPAVSQGWSSLSLQRTSSFGSFDRFRHHSISKTDDSAEVCITQSFTFFSSLSHDSYAKTLWNYCVNFTLVRTLWGTWICLGNWVLARMNKRIAPKFWCFVGKTRNSFSKRQKNTSGWCIPKVTSMCMQTTDVSFSFTRSRHKSLQFSFGLRTINNGKQNFLSQKIFYFCHSHIHWCAVHLFRYMIPQENDYDWLLSF